MPPAFTITYWGTTGTMAAPLRPPEVTDKLVRALVELTQSGRLADLRPGPGLEDAARRAIEALPFSLRSTYGGNTTCVEVRTPDALIILDCGSGLREFGAVLEARWRKEAAAAVRRAHVLVTHPHIDHTYGTPYFAPYYNPGNQFTVWGSREVLDSLRAVLDPASALSRLYFPPTYEQLTALRDFREIKAGDGFVIGSTRVTTYPLTHPGGCLAYRLETGGKVFVFATDHEQPKVPDRALATFARGADLLYTEGQYTAAEYEGKEGIVGDPPMARRGWGHSPVEACVVTAVAADVRQLHVGHREPRRGDDDLARVEAYVQRLMRDELRRAGRAEDACKALVPYEGLVVEL
jgi:phosphoribosyl 1,2-cyclic phosphodiesterase